MTGSSGNDIRKCALEATDELIVRLLGIIAKYGEKIGLVTISSSPYSGKRLKMASNSCT
jgi:hypothetical protein